MGLRWGRPHPCLPTSDDQVLQGGPGIGEVPLLACLLERGQDSILVGEDPAVLEGSRHYRDCGWGLDREPRGWALLKPGDPSWAFSSRLTAAPVWPKWDLHAKTRWSRDVWLPLARDHRSESGRKQVVLPRCSSPPCCLLTSRYFRALSTSSGSDKQPAP